MKLLFLILLTLTSCGTGKQESCGFYTNVYGQRIFRHKTPITTYVDKSVPQKYHISIQKAAKTINKAAGSVVIALTYDVPYGANTNVIYYGTRSLEKNQQALTTIYWVSNEILKADIFVNNNFTFYNTGEKKDGFNFEALMLHEFGHFIGLNHDEVDSVMNSYLQRDTDRVNLTEKDIRNIQCVY